MEDTLISFETAKLAKEKEFDSYCYSWFFINSTDYNNTPKYYKEKCLAEYVEINEELIFHAIGGQHCKTVNSKFKNELNQPKVIACPTQSLLQKWLREVHNCFIDILPHRDGDSKNKQWKSKKDVFWTVEVDYYGKNFEIELTDDSDFTQHFNKTYEEALEIGLYQALLLI